MQHAHGSYDLFGVKNKNMKMKRREKNKIIIIRLYIELSVFCSKNWFVQYIEMLELIIIE